MRVLIILSVFLWGVVAEAQTVQFARGPREVVNGTVDNPAIFQGPFSFWTGGMDDVHDVIFIRGNFSRKVPHTVVFTNSSRLTFINCNLNNVEIQTDFVTKGSLTIHQHEEVIGPDTFVVVERGDNKTSRYRINSSTFDITDEEYPNLTVAERRGIRKMKQAMGEEITGVHTEHVEMSTEPTVINKRYTHRRIVNSTELDEHLPNKKHRDAVLRARGLTP